MSAPTVAVVGAGIAGLVAAQRLMAAGCTVTVFEKSRGPGGRCATRRSDVGPFHHGVAGFAAHGAAFRAALAAWQQAGVVQAGPGDRWAGRPTMNALARHLATGLWVQAGHTVQPPQRGADGRWQLATAEHGALREAFDTVLLAVPAEQARPLSAASPALQQALADVHSQPCWTWMLAWPSGAAPAALPGAEAIAAKGVLAEVVDVSGLPSEPGSPAFTRWVLHASAAWSTTHVELAAEAATQQLWQALQAACGSALPAPTHSAAHRWRYAQVAQPLAAACGWDATLRLGSCGDAWGGGPPGGAPLEGVERTWLSGQALAEAVLAAA